VICLSFDTDHLDGVRMQEFLAGVPIPGGGTFFCTQRYESLGEPHELCPHPLMAVAEDGGDDLSNSRSEFAGAVGWRSHSCVYSHMVAVRLAAAGYLYASTQYQPVAPARPFREAWGLWQMPIFYMDNADFSWSRFWADADHEPFASNIIDTALSDADGVYVFDFHPIHLLLNSVSADAYLERREAFLAGAPLGALRCRGRGARTFYDDLCAQMHAAGLRSLTMRQALAEWLQRE